ncbi:MAG: shikimate dehydrogenase [Thiohalomonadaceae bacterium]
MTDRYAVMGNPIAHSKSPQIHAMFARQTRQDLSYTAILVELDGFTAAVTDFRAGNGQGLNVTVPFKQEAWALAQRRSRRAELAGAVNTLYWDERGILSGDNTDGVGLVRDLQDNHDVALAGRNILLLGAGGAVRGVLEPLLATAPARLVIANRTPARAEELANHFAALGQLQASGFAALAGQQFDLIINGTAASLQGEVPSLPTGILAEHGVCYDMMYGKEPTAFLRWALKAGASKAIDGLGMLVEQAAEAFFIWRGVRPATAEVIAALRQ